MGWFYTGSKLYINKIVGKPENQQESLAEEQKRVEKLVFPINHSTTKVWAGWCVGKHSVIISILSTDQTCIPYETPEMKAFCKEHGRPCWTFMHQWCESLEDSDEPHCVCYFDESDTEDPPLGS